MPVLSCNLRAWLCILLAAFVVAHHLEAGEPSRSLFLLPGALESQEGKESIVVVFSPEIAYSPDLMVRGTLRVETSGDWNYAGLNFEGAEGKSGTIKLNAKNGPGEIRFEVPIWRMLPAEPTGAALWKVGDAIRKITVYSKLKGAAPQSLRLEQLEVAADPARSRAAMIRKPVEVRPELVGTHPRLLLDAGTLAAFREKIKQPETAGLWKAYLDFADRKTTELPPEVPKQSEDPFRSYGARLPTTALAYLGTGDPKYLESTRLWILALCRYGEWAGNTDLAAGHICFGMALAYDWLYDKFTPEERQEIERVLAEHGRILYARSLADQGRWWASSWWQNHSWINHTGLSAAAAALLETHPRESREWLDHARGCFQFTYDSFGPDGSNYEGVGYARYGAQWMVYYAELIRSLSGENLYAMPHLRHLTEYLLYTLLPDKQTVVNFADCPTGKADARDFLARLASEYRDGHGQWLAQELRDAPEGTVTSAFEVLWDDPSVKPKVPDDLPTSAFFPDLGLAIFRSGWSKGASIVAIKCGPPSGISALRAANTLPVADATFGHAHPDANSFLWWAEGAWRIGDPAGYTRYKATHYENVWLAGPSGQRGEREWLDASSYLGDTAQAWVVRVATSPKADYFVGEAAPAYEPEARLKSFRRHLLFVKSARPYLVIWDRIESATPHVWTNCLHAESGFSVTGPDQFQTGGPGQVFCTFRAEGSWNLSSGFLKVIGQKTKATEVKGCEILIQSGKPSAAASMVTVLSLDEPVVRSVKDAPAPDLFVGPDHIVWSAGGEVTLNGETISEDLSPLGQ
ncbi:MAG: DUF4962 domain-containing protein [Terrimicrobiaceae bacterium]